MRRAFRILRQKAETIPLQDHNMNSFLAGEGHGEGKRKNEGEDKDKDKAHQRSNNQ